MSNPCNAQCPQILQIHRCFAAQLHRLMHKDSKRPLGFSASRREARSKDVRSLHSAIHSILCAACGFPAMHEFMHKFLQQLLGFSASKCEARSNNVTSLCSTIPSILCTVCELPAMRNALQLAKVHIGSAPRADRNALGLCTVCTAHQAARNARLQPVGGLTVVCVSSELLASAQCVAKLQC